MNIGDMDAESAEDMALAQAMEDSFDEAMGEAMDLAFDIKREIVSDVPKSLVSYIAEKRRDAIESLKRITVVDSHDAASIRAIQMDVLVYRSAVAFAQKAIVGYMQDGGSGGFESTGTDIGAE